MKDTYKLSYCSLYCGTCGVYQGTQQNDEKLLKLMVRVYQKSFPENNNITIDSIKCDGCLSKNVSILCKSCPIKKCAISKQIKGCHKCSEFPCPSIINFPIPSGKSEMLQSVRCRAELGTLKWVEHKQERYCCPKCNQSLFRGTSRCKYCKTSLTTWKKTTTPGTHNS